MEKKNGASGINAIDQNTSLTAAAETTIPKGSLQANSAVPAGKDTQTTYSPSTGSSLCTSDLPPQAPVAAHTWLPIALSVLALIVATSNFIYTQIKDRRARKQSIQDDYWFRKIVSPITIEPLVKDLLLLTTELPVAGSVDIASAKILWQNQAQRLEQLGSSLGTLSLLSQEIPAKVIKHIEFISDELANYYGSYIEDSSNGTKLCDTELTRGSITKSMLSILKIIQLHQEKVGY